MTRAEEHLVPELLGKAARSWRTGRRSWSKGLELVPGTGRATRCSTPAARPTAKRGVLRLLVTDRAPGTAAAPGRSSRGGSGTAVPPPRLRSPGSRIGNATVTALAEIRRLPPGNTWANTSALRAAGAGPRSRRRGTAAKDSATQVHHLLAGSWRSGSRPRSAAAGGGLPASALGSRGARGPRAWSANSTS